VPTNRANAHEPHFGFGFGFRGKKKQKSSQARNRRPKKKSPKKKLRVFFSLTQWTAKLLLSLVHRGELVEALPCSWQNLDAMCTSLVVATA
jgi:hypothetical protein